VVVGGADGVGLGTTNSVIAAMEGGQPQVNSNAEVRVRLGREPCRLEGRTELDENGYLRTGPPNRCGVVPETDTSGVFAVGGVRSRSAQRVASAVGEIAMTIRLVPEFLERGDRA
jgi:thioredoxin reductase (NADPH)